MVEPHPSQALLDISADLRNWLEVHQELAAGPADCALPATRLTPEERTGATLDSVPAAPPALTPRPGLSAIREDLGNCTRCALHRGRNNIVFGAGNEQADILFVGGGPGLDDDRSGEPFAGSAGGLLTRIINNVLRLEREDVYLCSILKCRPQETGLDLAEEVATCAPYLWQQIDAIRPAVVVALGPLAVQTLLGTSQPLDELRGRAHPFRDATLVTTYHPAYLLSNPGDKRKVFDDMKLVRQEFQKRTGRSLQPIASAKGA